LKPQIETGEDDSIDLSQRLLELFTMIYSMAASTLASAMMLVLMCELFFTSSSYSYCKPIQPAFAHITNPPAATHP
jgi:hypothetical protein